ncbi:MAG: glycosyl transferase [Clostridiaceae bacterium]|mgnify:CR=1 FL=1|nr:glycosyl transferase [Clostridiaceae bacterium]
MKNIINSQRARGQSITAEKVAAERFSNVVMKGALSAQFVSQIENGPVLAVSGLPFYAPVASCLLHEAALYDIFDQAFHKDHSILFSYDNDTINSYVFDGASTRSIELSSSQNQCIKSVLENVRSWGGVLDQDAVLTCDPGTPAPGPHYFTNLLIGNRMDFSRPLQSTPKSVVDRLGRGSFRAHADTQVLATRWDYLPEENGFPANRQFYLLEDGKVFFYSGVANQSSVIETTCEHAQNHTVITYKTHCGLVISRTIFILPQEDGMPLATEVQMIRIKNGLDQARKIRLVYTGMFGTSEIHALREDVIFTTVVAQSEVFFDQEEKIRAFSFNPNPKWTKGNIRYCSMMVHQDDQVVFPDSYCAKYSEFVGSGTLENPEYAAFLSNRPSRKGPGFFALSAPMLIQPGKEIRADHFTCLSSDAVNDDYLEDETMLQELDVLLTRFKDPSKLPQTLKDVSSFTDRYASYLQIRHDDADFQAYVNKNLPYQVFYQTFVSRSFDWTQKGYREIGFREIQDVFASMYYFAGMGRTDFVKDLIREWAGNVFEEGYANHNFYWKGKEPGWWSDDALWLLQALDRYLKLTGDYEFLHESLPMAGEEGKKRPLTETIKAILSYSVRVSVGKHGLPLIDRADWNDCLRVDPDCISGPEKIEKYREQLEKNGKSYASVPFESEYAESVMNGFLAKVAIDAALDMFRVIKDEEYALILSEMSDRLRVALVESAWKDDFFARVLFNRKDKPNLSYLGAKGDGLAVEDGADGTYFLNAFSWSVLSGCASEEQIHTMLDTLDRNLRTPFGFRLCTAVDYPQIAPKIDVALYYVGDRENGGIFKHANMMAAAAMLKAARDVTDSSLAERLTETAYWVIDCILPYRTLRAPFEVCGNPRFCTQYNNSDNGENIGPTLSGTSTWLLLCLFMSLGIEFNSDGLDLRPMLRPSETGCEYKVNTGRALYDIRVVKPKGFRRCQYGVSVLCDGKPIEGTRVPIFEDGLTHEVIISL